MLVLTVNWLSCSVSPRAVPASTSADF